MGQGSEIDCLNQNLPEVFDHQQVPADWNEDWVIVPIDEPDQFDQAADNQQPLVNDLDQVNGWERVRDLLPDEVTGEFAGSFLKKWDLRDGTPPPDCLAFYLPFHIFYPDWWGIYLLHEGIRHLAEVLSRGSFGSLSIIECTEIARIFLFGHEQFHHAVESFASRLEATNRVPMFRTGFTALYRLTYDTDDCLEEALANAHGVRRVREAMRKARKPTRERLLADQALKIYMDMCPPRYCRGFEFVDDEQYENGRNELAERAHILALPSRKRTDPSVWSAFPRAFQPFRTRTGGVNYLVHRDSSFGRRLRLDPNTRYYRYREVVRQLERLAGCELVRSSGSHHLFRTKSGRTIPVPRHPGDIGMGLLHKIIREAGLNMSVLEFMQA